MSDFFATADRLNNPVLARTAVGVSALTTELAERLYRQNRKVNSGTPVQAKRAVPWYRRFDKR